MYYKGSIGYLHNIPDNVNSCHNIIYKIMTRKKPICVQYRNSFIYIIIYIFETMYLYNLKQIYYICIYREIYIYI